MVQLSRHAGGHLPWIQEEFTPTTGQITFIISNLPTDVASFEFNVDGVLFDEGADYTISGSTITWINSIVLKPVDKVIVRYQ